MSFAGIVRAVGADVRHLPVGTEVLGHAIGEVRDFGPAGAAQIISHLLIVAEHRGGSPNFSTHVANSSLTGTRQVVGTLAEIFYNGARTTFHG